MFCPCLQIFVGGLDPTVTDDDLRQVFSQFGDLVYVKIPLGKGCGFVQFTHRCLTTKYFFCSCHVCQHKFLI
jgi:RNA recognition motif-containing protein